jgi:hypothetical protein
VTGSHGGKSPPNFKPGPLQAILIFTTMRKYIFILFTVTILGCSTETEYLDFEQIFGKQQQEFLISNLKDNVIIGEQGTIIRIPKNTIEALSEYDSVKVILKEYYQISDMIKAGLSTTSNGKLLETKGMLNLQVFANNQKIRLPLNPVDFTFALQDIPDNYQMFYSNTKNGTINWNLDTITKNYNIFYNYVISGTYENEDDLDQGIVELRADSIAWSKNYTQIDTIETYLESPDTIYNPKYEWTDEVSFKQSKKIYRALPFEWINLDVFLELNNLTNITIKSKKINNPYFYCVFQKYNTLTSTYEQTINGIPIGETVTFIGIDYQDGDIYFDIKKDVLIKSEMEIKLDLEKTEESAVDSYLKELNKK